MTYTKPRPFVPDPMNHPITKTLGAQMQVVETALNVAEKAYEDDLPGLAEFFMHQASLTTSAVSSTLTESLGYLSEWQVAAFHDQYDVLRDRYNALILIFTTTKEN